MWQRLALCAERMPSVMLRTREADARADSLLEPGQTSLDVMLKSGQIRGQLVSRLQGWQPIITDAVQVGVYVLCANNFE